MWQICRPYVLRGVLRFLGGTVPWIDFAISLLPFERIESAEMGSKAKTLIEGDAK